MARVNRRLQERLNRRRLITRIIISSLILISVGLLFISRTNDPRFYPVRNFVEGIGGKAVSAINTPVRKFKGFWISLRDLQSTRADNERLRNENIKLRQYRFRTQALSAKVERLEEILSVQSNLDIPTDPIAVRIVSETRGPFAYSVLINSGQSNNVKVGYPVMHEQGLLGHVIRVGSGSSRVLLLQDLNSRVSVMSADSEARAVLIGKNDQPPQLDFYDDPSKWKDGSMVVTSGDDGFLPQGLPIGVVIHENDDDIRVSLFSRESIDWAWVYPFEALKTPEDDPASPQGTEKNISNNEGAIESDETPDAESQP